MNPITINGNTLDPSQPTTHGFGPVADDAAATDYIVLQTSSEVLHASDYAKLDELGVKLLQIVSNKTYLCAYKNTDLNAIRALPFAAYVDTYRDNFVVAPSLKAQHPEQSPLVMQTGPGAFSGASQGATDGSPSPVEVDIVLHGDAAGSEEAIRSHITRLAGANSEGLVTHDKRLRAKLPRSQLAELAKVDEVQAILPVHEVKLFNDVARKILHSDVEINGTAYKGKGQIVCVADTGFDLGDTHNVPAPFQGRVIKLIPVGRGSGPNGLTDDPEGHGTHVCGSAVGDGKLKDGTKMEAAASKAGLIVQSILAPNGKGLLPGLLDNLLAAPYAAGARVHTNSWGAATPSIPYDLSAAPKDLDTFVYKRRDLVICFAAGNDGVDMTANTTSNSTPDGIVDLGQVGSEAIAKNIITIGASESVRPDVAWRDSTWGELSDKFPRAPLRDDHVANNSEEMAPFSSRGPALPSRGEKTHLRIKPDIVAPGTAILSTKSRHPNVIPPAWGPTPDPSWMWDFGTSMACPLVAGCCAVIREFLEANGHPNPSAALVKAALINGAVPLPSETKTPNFNSGFGRVNLQNTLVPSKVKEGTGFVEGKPLTTGEEHIISVNIPANISSATSGMAPTLKVTLVWTDVPGPLLNNDLDLIVKAGDAERHGNLGESSDFDRINNVEQVTWEHPPTGHMEIIVRAFNIPRLEDNLAQLQDYALVWKLFA